MPFMGKCCALLHDVATLLLRPGGADQLGRQPGPDVESGPVRLCGIFKNRQKLDREIGRDPERILRLPDGFSPAVNSL